MKHQMKLWNEPFNKIAMKTKRVEMRLNDEKRATIKENDIIEFINVETQEVVEVRVKALKKFKDFKELYFVYDKITIGYSKNEEVNYKDMFLFYSEQDIKKYGALAIEIEIIE